MQDELLTSDEGILTVSAVADLVRAAIEAISPAPVAVRGEIRKFHRHKSGHVYMDLADENAVLRVVMFRYYAGNLDPEVREGVEVLVEGDLSVYPARSEYQLRARRVVPLKEGLLKAKFEMLLKKLKEEGLFDESRKRPIPFFPEKIGIVTSDRGAAIGDMLRILKKRMPSVEVYLYPVNVQGEKAAQEIVSGIGFFNHTLKVDLIIVGRGGGSVDDLAPFNEEVVARAIFASGIPVISAVGHERDVLISDLVADRRAPTPTAAAVMAVPDREELIEQLRLYTSGWREMELIRIIDERERLEGLKKTLGRFLDRIEERIQYLDDLIMSMNSAVQNRIHALRSILEERTKGIRGLGPERQLALMRESLMAVEKALFVEMKRATEFLREDLKRSGRALLTLPFEKNIKEQRVSLLQIEGELERSMDQTLCSLKERVELLRGTLVQADPRNIKKRGFALLRDKKGRIIERVSSMKKGMELSIDMYDGKADCIVNDIEKRD